MATTSMSLDTTYTAKSVRGLVGEMKNNPNRFKGKNILFIHTGQLRSINAEFISYAYYILNVLLQAYFRPISKIVWLSQKCGTPCCIFDVLRSKCFKIITLIGGLVVVLSCPSLPT